MRWNEGCLRWARGLFRRWGQAGKLASGDSGTAGEYVITSRLWKCVLGNVNVSTYKTDEKDKSIPPYGYAFHVLRISYLSETVHSGAWWDYPAFSISNFLLHFSLLHFRLFIHNLLYFISFSTMSDFWSNPYIGDWVSNIYIIFILTVCVGLCQRSHHFSRFLVRYSKSSYFTQPLFNGFWYAQTLWNRFLNIYSLSSYP